jgi:hypothetical protein
VTEAGERDTRPARCGQHRKHRLPEMIGEEPANQTHRKQEQHQDKCVALAEEEVLVGPDTDDTTHEATDQPEAEPEDQDQQNEAGNSPRDPMTRLNKGSAPNTSASNAAKAKPTRNPLRANRAAECARPVRSHASRMAGRPGGSG